jgi:hypothetical protein
LKIEIFPSSFADEPKPTLEPFEPEGKKKGLFAGLKKWALPLVGLVVLAGLGAVIQIIINLLLNLEKRF